MAEKQKELLNERVHNSYVDEYAASGTPTLPALIHDLPGAAEVVARIVEEAWGAGRRVRKMIQS